MELNEIRDNQGAHYKFKRVGRGIGSGKGKTCGRGVKGQKSRTGVALKGYEGGQMPLYRRLPKRGFTNIFRKEYAEINLGTLQEAVDAGKIAADKPLDYQALAAANLVRGNKDGLKILGQGTLSAKLNLLADKASKSAVAAFEKAGGTLTLPAAEPSDKAA